MPRKLNAMFLFALMAVLGFFVTKMSWNGETFISVSNIRDQEQRSPAAVKKVFDYSQFEGTVLSSMSKQRIVLNASVAKNEGSIGVALGHFVVKSDQGQPLLACQMYDKVVLEYEAEGMAVGGETPRMQVRGPCSVVQDLNRMESLWIPFAKIQAEKAVDGEFNFNEPNSISIEFRSLAGEWPKRWAFKAVQLMDSKNNNSDLSVSAVEAGREVASALVIDLN